MRHGRATDVHTLRGVMTRARSRRLTFKRKRKALAKPAKVKEPSRSPEARIIELMAENASLRERIDELEDKLKQANRRILDLAREVERLKRPK